MRYDNDAEQLKHRVPPSATRLSYDNQLSEHPGDAPCETTPGPQPALRCCIYREREIIRECVSATCGEDLPHQEDKAVMGVPPTVCEGCPISRSNVTGNYQKCLARKRVAACPFGVVSVTGCGAYIDPAKYRRCGRCAAVCPYNATSDTMRPRLRSCPVNAITMDEHRLAAIDYSRRISHGACMVGCPLGAITDRSSMASAVREIQSGERVYVASAPAIEGHFGTANTGQLKEGLRQLGFADTVEASLGADATAYREVWGFGEVVAEGKKITASCCSASIDMIEKYFPKSEPSVSYTASPMTLTVWYLKEDEPDIKVAFPDPCVAEKPEIQKAENTIDYVMTFEELAAMFSTEETEVETLEVEDIQDSSIKGKNLTVSGGVTAAVEAALAESGFGQPVPCVKCSDAEECKKQLMMTNVGRMQEDLIGGMTCEDDRVAGSDGVEPVQKLMKNRQELPAAAGKRSIEENLEQVHNPTHIHMEQRV